MPILVAIQSQQCTEKQVDRAWRKGKWAEAGKEALMKVEEGMREKGGRRRESDRINKGARTVRESVGQVKKKRGRSRQ